MNPAHDDQKRWTDAGIWEPPNFDVRGFQKAIDNIVGKSASDYSIVRLMWAWECRRWQNVKWDEFGNATEGEWRQKYKALTIEIGNDEYVDISPPRWVLEERFEPGQYANSWESSRYVHDPENCRRCQIGALGIVEQSTSCIRRDVFGPPPRDGWYNLLPHIGIIAEHEHGMQCCDRLWSESKEICFGRYKVPNHVELDALRRAIRLRNQDEELNPHQELSPQALQEAMRWGMQEAQEVQVKSREDLKAQIKDEVQTHGASIIPPEALVALKGAGRRVPVHKTVFS